MLTKLVSEVFLFETRIKRNEAVKWFGKRLWVNIYLKSWYQRETILITIVKHQIWSVVHSVFNKMLRRNINILGTTSHIINTYLMLMLGFRLLEDEQILIYLLVTRGYYLFKLIFHYWTSIWLTLASSNSQEAHLSIARMGNSVHVFYV